jgi:hypothetical protein
VAFVRFFGGKMEDATESSIHLEDSPTNFIEMEISTKNYIETVLYTYVIRVVCAVGIFGNVAILVVLSRRGAKETAFGKFSLFVSKS